MIVICYIYSDVCKIREGIALNICLENPAYWSVYICLILKATVTPFANLGVEVLELNFFLVTMIFLKFLKISNINLKRWKEGSHSLFFKSFKDCTAFYLFFHHLVHAIRFYHTNNLFPFLSIITCIIMCWFVVESQRHSCWLGFLNKKLDLDKDWGVELRLISGCLPHHWTNV